MKLEVLDVADCEVAKEVRYYNSKSPGLGTRFVVAVNECFEIIKEWPGVYRALKGGYRCRGVKVFPHAVIYKVYNNVIYVVAVAPYRRRPYYWMRRKVPR